MTPDTETKGLPCETIKTVNGKCPLPHITEAPPDSTTMTFSVENVTTQSAYVTISGEPRNNPLCRHESRHTALERKRKRKMQRKARRMNRRRK